MNDPRLTLVKDDGRSQEEGAGTLPDRHWHELGEEPDYRFSLANERTFLAWIRTALALMAAAVGVTVVRSTVEPRALLVIGGFMPAALSVLICTLAYPQWAAKQKAMRLAQPLPFPWILRPIAFTLAAVGATVVAMVLVR